MISIWKKKKMKELTAYLDGRLLPIHEVPDEIFSKKMMGDGVAIIAVNEEVCAPCDGEISLIAPTKHAIAITTDDHIQLLIHIGLDSANLPKDCFDVLISQGERVKQGQPLVHIASSYLQSQSSLYVPMVMIDPPKNISFHLPEGIQQVKRKESVIISYE